MVFEVPSLTSAMEVEVWLPKIPVVAFMLLSYSSGSWLCPGSPRSCCSWFSPALPSEGQRKDAIFRLNAVAFTAASSVPGRGAKL